MYVSDMLFTDKQACLRMRRKLAEEIIDIYADREHGHSMSTNRR